MLRYVAKNKSIPAFFKQVSENPSLYETKIALLNKAITTDYVLKPNAEQLELFADPEAPLLLLYAIENKLVPYWPGHTLLTYFIALAQFTDKQALRAEHTVDQNPKTRIKQLRDINPTPLTEIINGREDMTVDGNAYLDHVIYLYKLFDINIDKNKLCRFILSLPALEKVIFKIDNYPGAFDKVDTDTMLRRIKENVPFFRSTEDAHFVLPSASLINYFMKESCDTPMKMHAFVGVIKTQTRHQEHLNNKNPIAYYLKEVVSSLVNAHDLNCGPFPLLVHDIGHTFWANLLTKEERDILHLDLIPFFEAKAAYYNTNSSLALGARLTALLTDYDLTPVMKYANKKIRLTQHVMVILSLEMKRQGYIGDNDVHECDILIALRDFVAEKMTQPYAHPFWLTFCEQLDNTYKAILRPLVCSEDQALTSQINLFRERELKRHKLEEEATITNHFGISTDGYC